jgi:hypothetical protein
MKTLLTPKAIIAVVLFLLIIGLGACTRYLEEETPAGQVPPPTEQKETMR